MVYPHFSVNGVIVYIVASCPNEIELHYNQLSPLFLVSNMVSELPSLAGICSRIPTRDRVSF